VYNTENLTTLLRVPFTTFRRPGTDLKSVPYIDAAVDAAGQDDFRERSKNECLSMRPWDKK